MQALRWPVTHITTAHTHHPSQDTYLKGFDDDHDEEVRQDELHDSEGAECRGEAGPRR